MNLNNVDLFLIQLGQAQVSMLEYLIINISFIVTAMASLPPTAYLQKIPNDVGKYLIEGMHPSALVPLAAVNRFFRYNLTQDGGLFHSAWESCWQRFGIPPPPHCISFVLWNKLLFTQECFVSANLLLSIINY